MIGKGFFVKNRISSDIGAMGNGAVAAIAMVPGRVAEEDTGTRAGSKFVRGIGA